MEGTTTWLPRLTRGDVDWCYKQSLVTQLNKQSLQVSAITMALLRWHGGDYHMVAASNKRRRQLLLLTVNSHPDDESTKVVFQFKLNQC